MMTLSKQDRKNFLKLAYNTIVFSLLNVCLLLSACNDSYILYLPISGTCVLDRCFNFSGGETEVTLVFLGNYLS